jgi:hypothetical protein
LKEDFNLPSRIDFAFSLNFDDGTELTADRNIPSGIEVLAENERVEVLRLDGSSEFAEFSLKVW